MFDDIPSGNGTEIHTLFQQEKRAEPHRKNAPGVRALAMTFAKNLRTFSAQHWREIEATNLSDGDKFVVFESGLGMALAGMLRGWPVRQRQQFVEKLCAVSRRAAP